MSLPPLTDQDNDLISDSLVDLIRSNGQVAEREISSHLRLLDSRLRGDDDAGLNETGRGIVSDFRENYIKATGERDDNDHELYQLNAEGLAYARTVDRQWIANDTRYHRQQYGISEAIPGSTEQSRALAVRGCLTW